MAHSGSILSRSGFVCLWAMTGSVAHATTVSIADSVFLDSDWLGAALIDTTPGDTFTMVAGQAGTGGNPGTYRSLTHQSTSPAGAVVNVMSGHVFLARQYVLASEGAIESLDVSYDGISLGSTAGAVAYAALIRQADTDYVVFGGPALNGAGWAGFSLSTLTASNFSAVTSNGFDGNLHPDFSTGGAALYFGFAAFNGTFGNSVNVGGIDNWQVTLTKATPIPVPAIGMLWPAALLLGLQRRRSPATG